MLAGHTAPFQLLVDVVVKGLRILTAAKCYLREHKAGGRSQRWWLTQLVQQLPAQPLRVVEYQAPAASDGRWQVHMEYEAEWDDENDQDWHEGLEEELDGDEPWLWSSSSEEGEEEEQQEGQQEEGQQRVEQQPRMQLRRSSGQQQQQPLRTQVKRRQQPRRQLKRLQTDDQRDAQQPRRRTRLQQQQDQEEVEGSESAGASPPGGIAHQLCSCLACAAPGEPSLSRPSMCCIALVNRKLPFSVHADRQECQRQGSQPCIQ
jgi:hypothetical protein